MENLKVDKVDAKFIFKIGNGHISTCRVDSIWGQVGVDGVDISNPQNLFSMDS